MGKHGAYDKVTHDAIVKALRAGYTDQDAAISAGIRPPTLSNWLNPDGAPKYARLRKACQLARLDAKRALMGVIRASAFGQVKKEVICQRCEHKQDEVFTVPKDWHAADKLLQKLHPEEWGSRIEMRVKFEIIQPIVWNIIGAIKRHVKDRKTLEALSRELTSLHVTGNRPALEARAVSDGEENVGGNYTASRMVEAELSDQGEAVQPGEAPPA